MLNRLLFLVLLLIAVTTHSNAQLIGANTYLQGAYVEIGICPNGALGAPAPPAGYHPHICYTCVGVTPSTNIAEMYDYGHDGWLVGAPTFMGDYTYPGSPFEGWTIQANGQRAQGYYNGGGTFAFSGGGTMAGAGPVSYSNAGGIIRGNWAGNTSAGNLRIRMETRVDTLASAVVMTVRLNNTGLTAIPGVYYWRSCDPDNDVTWAGGSFLTDNVINSQVTTPGNPKHKVSVTATGRSSTLPPMTLCTKDARAVAIIYGSWGLTVGQDLAMVWNQTYGGGGAFYNVGVNHPGDIGIGIVWNLCTIDAGDSTSLSYAYVFNGAAGIDDPGALPDPILTVGGIPFATAPHAHDTLDGCLLPGVDSVAIDIPYGSDKSWTSGHWTWTPSTGLTATTGSKVFVRLSAIPGYLTYTVTGKTDTGSCSPNLTDTFVFTVHSCHLAWASDPCLGDALALGMLGDSIGATYYWMGPTGFTSTMHNPWIYPTTWSDTGLYAVIRTIGGVNDTDSVRVVIHPLPVVSPTSNIPNKCDPQMDPMNLFVNLDSIGETFYWTGPGGFTSTLQNPSLPGFDSSKEGTYVVTGTTIWGCKATASTSVIPGIRPGFVFQVHYGCYYDTVYFINTSYNAKTYDWYFGDATAAMHTRHTMHIYKASNRIWPVTLHLANDNCDTTIIINVDLRHEINAEFEPTPDTICLGTGAVVGFLNTSNAVDSMFTGLAPSAYAWYFGDGGTDNSATPTHTYMTPGKFPVKLVVSDAMGCQDSMAKYVYVIHLDIKSFNDTLLCISQPLAMRNEIIIIPDIDIRDKYKFSWTQSEPNLDDTTVQIPNLSGIGDFYNVLTVTIPGVPLDGCPALDTIHVRSVLGRKLQQLTVTQSIDYGESIQLNANNEVIYYWLPNDGSLNNNNISNPVATPIQTTTYTVFGIDVNGCRDSAYITIYVDTSMTQDIPTGFTPNGDGLNDVFRPVGIKFQRMVEFRVFNRWGQELFFTNNKEEGWDGTFHGMKQDLGVYNYLIIVAKPGGDNVVYKGNVTLIR